MVDELIEETRRRFGVTSVVISHDMTSALKIADHIFLLQKGRLVGGGSPWELVHGPIELAHQFLESSGIDAEALLRARQSGGKKSHVGEAPDKPPGE
jgi:phospholipid/cholesterol/gamma-HCH transport system ATP-binding protein